MTSKTVYKAFPRLLLKLPSPFSLGISGCCRLLIWYCVVIINKGAATKPRALCVMHTHGLLLGVRWYRGTRLWPLQVVPAYHCNPKFSFSKSYHKKSVLLKTKVVLDIKNLRLNTLSCFNKGTSKPKNFAKTNPCLE